MGSYERSSPMIIRIAVLSLLAVATLTVSASTHTELVQHPGFAPEGIPHLVWHYQMATIAVLEYLSRFTASGSFADLQMALLALSPCSRESSIASVFLTSVLGYVTLHAVIFASVGLSFHTFSDSFRLKVARFYRKTQAQLRGASPAPVR